MIFHNHNLTQIVKNCEIVKLWNPWNALFSYLEFDQLKTKKMRSTISQFSKIVKLWFQWNYFTTETISFLNRVIIRAPQDVDVPAVLDKIQDVDVLRRPGHNFTSQNIFLQLCEKQLQMHKNQKGYKSYDFSVSCVKSSVATKMVSNVTQCPRVISDKCYSVQIIQDIWQK